MTLVALLAEGVDRNIASKSPDASTIEVALLAEGVDRNTLMLSRQKMPGTVALLAEGVDRNFCPEAYKLRTSVSPSSRRAWIEITNSLLATTRKASRPPRGGRG